MNSSPLHSFDLTATLRMSSAEGPALVRTERALEQSPGALRRRAAGTQPPPVAARSACCVEPVLCACGIAERAAHELDARLETVTSALALECAKEAHDDLFEHRRGVWDCGDGLSCLFDNDPEAHRAVEIETLRALLTTAGCTEVGFATYPPQGHDDPTHTLAVLVRGDAETILAVYEAVDRRLDEARAFQAH